MNKLKRLYIVTFGCQMNVRDSEVIYGLLKKEGYKFTNDPNKADIILFNTCSVRQHAEDKVWSEIGRFKTHKPIIGLIGCMAQEHKEKIFERAPQVDFVVGPSDIDKIPDIIKKAVGCRLSAVSLGLFEKKIWETDGEIRPEEIYHTGFYADKEHVYVVISEGCSNFCSYCVVPYVRGPLHNRNYQDVLKEIKKALDKGITRITLLGQNVNAYVSNSCLIGRQVKSQAQERDTEVNFIELLERVDRIKGLKEFGFITSYPKDTSINLFKAMQECEKLKKYLHLPVQSGSDRILKLMNRGYSRKFYLDLVEDYRKIIKGSVLTTDIIVGFPTEKEEDFQDTYQLIKDIRFYAAYIFKYSPRPNTEAAKMIDDVPREEKERRHKVILELQKAISKQNK